MYHIYDIETYKNIFTLAWRTWKTKEYKVLEISDRKNEIDEIIDTLYSWSSDGDSMIGFNNVMFDYPVLHYLINNAAHITAHDLYERAQEIIRTPWHNRYSNVIWDRDCLVRQIDLLLVNHFDNAARRTSLKNLEFNMRLSSVESLPYSPHSCLSFDQCDRLIEYNFNDVAATYKFFLQCVPSLKFRKELSKIYNIDFTNYNDTKIGKSIFINKLEEHSPGSCYTRAGGRKKPRQTVRESVFCGDIIFPYIKFDTPEASNILEKFKNLEIPNVKDGVKKAFKTFEINDFGIPLNFQKGGLHGSVKKTTYVSDTHAKIIDIDVKSFYPNLSISNLVYPAHLDVFFCDIYSYLYKERTNYPKGHPVNKALKLALNGVYGDSNNGYSPFFDFQYTMTITINGQLLLAMLIEMIILNVKGVELIQANTDGLTFVVPSNKIDDFNVVRQRWEKLTKLELESTEYNRMFVRDVNNYIAEYPSKKVKRKGVYEYDLEWHKNHSQLSVKKAAERKLLHGVDIAKSLYENDDAFDFMIRERVTNESKLFLNQTEELDKCIRYYVANTNDSLYKFMPPTKKKPNDWRWISVKKNFNVALCNKSKDFDYKKLNLDYYIKETEKITDLKNKMELS